MESLIPSGPCRGGACPALLEKAGRGKEDPSSVAACAVTPFPGGGRLSGGWKPPLRDAFGQFVGAHIVRPPSLWARPDGVSGPMRYGLFPVTRRGGACPALLEKSGTGKGRPLIRRGARRDTFPRRGKASGGWKPPLRDAFGQFVGAHIVRPPSLWARPDGVSGPMRYGLFPVTP